MVVVTTRPEHWEPPDPQKLLISARRVAEELDVTPGKANELCWALDRRFYAPGQIHYRVTKRSFNDLKRLVELGLRSGEARDIVGHFKGQQRPVPDDLDLDAARELLFTLRWRRRRR
ncbi:hypothetical protein ACT17Q_14890 [Cellulomonas sp. CW35]|uniref:hypothetical protein n=1 Tax=Cellulomonas sp. CW35 TaxID=3458249 RepID=UPI0040343A26